MTRDTGSGAAATARSVPRAEADKSGTGGSQRSDDEFAIVPSRVLRVLLIVIAVLVAASTAGQVIVHYAPDFQGREWFAKLLYVNAEQSLPTLYSSLLLLVAALLFGVIAHAHHRSGGPYERHWGALSLLFVILAVDEFASLHEQGDKLRTVLHIHGGPLWFASVIPLAALVVVLAVAFLPFFRHLPRLTRRYMSMAGILFITGALGVEMVAGAYDAARGSDMGYALISTVEETLEMLGVAVLLYALLAYISLRLTRTSWRLWVASEAPPMEGVAGAEGAK